MLRKGISPDKRTYALLVNAWCSAGKLREARQFLQEISDKGFTPPLRGRDLLIEGLLNAGYYYRVPSHINILVSYGFIIVGC